MYAVADDLHQLLRALWDDPLQEDFQVAELLQLQRLFEEAAEVDVWEAESNVDAATKALTLLKASCTAVAPANQDLVLVDDNFASWIQEKLEPHEALLEELAALQVNMGKRVRELCELCLQLTSKV